MRRRATMADVAAAAGVTPAAVSYALSGSGRLSELTRTRIVQAAHALGYVRDANARALRRGCTDTLGLVLPQSIDAVLANPYYTEFIAGLGEVCRVHGLKLTLIPPSPPGADASLVSAAADGFIVSGVEAFLPQVEMLHATGVPVVLVDSDSYPGVAAIEIDERAGVRAAVRHLLAAGHRSLAFLAVDTGTQDDRSQWRGPMARRIEGAGEALAEFGLSLDDEHITVIEVECTRDGGTAGLNRLWARPGRPTAVVALSDVIAIGVLQAARALGVEVPRDVSVIGFDDIAEARWSSPALSTIAQPVREKGQLAGEMLVARIAGGPIPDSPTVLPVTFIERGSHAQAPSTR